MEQQEKQQRREFVEMKLASDARYAVKHASDLVARLESIAESARHDWERGASPRMLADTLTGRLESVARDAYALVAEGKQVEDAQQLFYQLTGEVPNQEAQS